MTTGHHRKATRASVQLWRVDLEVRPEVEAEFHDRLLPREAQRAEGIANASARRRYIVTRGTLRELLGSLLDEDPRSVPIDAGPSGKPHLAGPNRRFQFNVSHSRDLAMIAITDCFDVGVDLESLRHIPSAVALARRHFAPAETNFVERGAPTEADDRFLRCWTRKEALGKAMGTEVGFNLLRLPVPLASTGGIIPVDHGGEVQHWVLLDVPLGGEYVAAMALPAAVVRHSVGLAPEFARAQSRHRHLDHCEEIDVLPLLSRAAYNNAL